MLKDSLRKKVVASENNNGQLLEAEQRLAGGLRFANLMSYMNQRDVGENRLLLHALVEVLVSKGVIHLDELETRKKELEQYFSKKAEQSPKVYLVETSDKYSCEDNVAVDCASRYHICRTACCKLWFALSVQDLDERIVRWNYSQPYSIAQNEDGYCVHSDPITYKCTIYENRPLVCRSYNCSGDKRIWADFDKMELNAGLLEVQDKEASEARMSMKV